MSLIVDQKEPTYTNRKIRISDEVFSGCEKYQEFGGFVSVDRVIEKACEYILNSDRDFKKFLDKKEGKKEVKKESIEAE